ncbi:MULTISPECIES: xanthine dehydrogenase family protein molybdopterin-binding subunit [unclassified Bradyrhizobium]|uniref:xanthine dehydrogenase family protein molybdopterin-binding subunit n=1 Tax=unclassified Bradyrhizobium TaxID=2631580 RepID=UPI001FF8BD06|nr:MULTISPECIES: xanthine dehydrogenase family protein molybdopterin-binding subunit [unclassified Bradyrhizobium]MCK1268465.1 xanthine dehydrogenase family protein molybdopterin-binding subunit [Bradyrhizobium sp. 84]MCK1373888.1 xanthine dehydrogenase family protein molybdopterin-binding subunit [Bradyrhizobium sp. 49]MCK1522799.1 xanthine dehydrogenase family protein molybdopterin-binding subunit [Bradyrhizobium sp. 17]MCK1686719.1 xanthine dehydrogenase family protein molybdopterin-binding 
MSAIDNMSSVRPDLIEKVTGRAEYVTDLTVPGMLHGFVVRSPAIHARIASIDSSVARAMDGVVDVLIGEDVASFGNWGVVLKDRPIIATDRVRYVGEPVAVVIAETIEIAENAAELVDVGYDDLPRATTIQEALAEEAPLIHERHENLEDFYFKGGARPTQNTNIFHTYRNNVGDVDAAEATAAYIHEDRFTFPAISHFAMEPHAVIADFQRDSLTVWAGAQTPTAVQKVLSRLFGLQLAKVRVIVPFVGGGFGGKASVKIEPLVAAASWKVQRPVRIAQSIAESMLTCRRLGADITIRTAVDANGRILAKSAKLLLDGGAYSDTGSAVATKAANRIMGPYAVPNLRLEACAVYTNTVPGAAFRSIGGPQAVWAKESHMDNVAAAIGMDPSEFRLRNLASRGERIRPDLRAFDMDMSELMGRVTQSFASEVKASNRQARGLAVAATDPANTPISNAIVRLKIDGSILVSVSSIEVGQGAHATMARIASQTLKQPASAVTVLRTDTAVAPYDWGTGASRSTVVVGLSVENAALDAADQILEMVADVWELPRENLSLVEGGVTTGSEVLTYHQIFHRTLGVDSGEVIGRGAITPRSKKGALVESPLFWETSAGLAEIIVDEDTGEIHVTRYASAADVGRVINRVAAEGQDEGAAIMGLGHALYEVLEFEDGQPVNATPIDYSIPRISDVPPVFDIILVENGDGPGPGGAKGMGEGAILPVAPAIANALFSAYGIRITELPMTPEKVWRALQKRN